MAQMLTGAFSSTPTDWPLEFLYGYLGGYKRLDFDELDLMDEDFARGYCWTPIQGFHTMIDDIMESFVEKDFHAVNKKMSDPALWTQYETALYLCKD